MDKILRKKKILQDPRQSYKIVQDPTQKPMEPLSILDKMLWDLRQDSEGVNSLLGNI